MADWDARMNPHTRALFQRFTEMIGKCGPYYFGPAKTRIAILARVRFAGLNALGEQSITISFALPKPIRSRRFATVVEIVPGWWGHRLKITELKQLDGELQEWLRQSYSLMGMQGRLAPKKPRK